MSKRKRRVTLSDVADAAGVSPMTVSRVLRNSKGDFSEETRLKVEKAVDALGYIPNRAARSLVTDRTFTVWVVVQDVTNPYFAQLVCGTEDTLWEEGYNIILSNSMENNQREEAALNLLYESAVDGLIVVSSRLPTADLLPLLRRHRAVVVVNRTVPTEIGASINNGDGPRIERGTQYLLESGRQNVICFNLRRPDSVDHLAGFTRAYAAVGREAPLNYVVPMSPTWKNGYKMAQAILRDHPEVDGIVGGNDLMALGAMRAVLDAGRRVPDDIAIIGGDDILMASQVTPALTTFYVPKYEIGVIAAQMLLGRMRGETEPAEYLYKEPLIVRDST